MIRNHNYTHTQNQSYDEDDDLVEDNQDFYGYEPEETDYIPPPKVSFMHRLDRWDLAKYTSHEQISRDTSILRPSQNPKQTTTFAPMSQTTEDKTASEQKLVELRARLMASRAATPNKSSSSVLPDTVVQSPIRGVPITTYTQGRTATPTNSNSKASLTDVPQSTPKNRMPRPTAASLLNNTSDNDPAKALDALLAEGFAEAQNKNVQEKEQPKTDTTQPNLATLKVASKASTTPSNLIKKHTKQHLSASKESTSLLNEPIPEVTAGTAPLNGDINERIPNEHTNLAKDSNDKPRTGRRTSEVDGNDGEPSSSQALSLYNAQSRGQVFNAQLMAKDAVQGVASQITNTYDGDDYKTDVELWLQLTGFYDSGFREQRLRTHKRRAQLLERKRLVDQELAALEQEEAAVAQDSSAMKYMRAQSVLDMPPPTLPASTTTSIESASKQMVTPNSENAFSPASFSNSKRPRSPENQQQIEQPASKLSRLDTSVHIRSKNERLDKPLSATSQKRWSTQR